MSSYQGTIEDSVLQLLKCPVCLDLCQAPIFTCVNGHSLCTDCKKRVGNCPVCRVPGTPSNRNLALDTLSEQVLTVPCKFQPKGCGVKRKREEDLESHYPICKFQFVCKCIAVVGCDFVGSRHQLHEHVKAKHPNKLLFTGDTFYNLYKADDYKEYRCLYKYEAEEECFWICSQRFNPGKILYFARYIGPEENASKFKVNLRIASADGMTTVLRFIREPLTLEENAPDSRNTMAIDEDYFEMIPTVGREVDFTLMAVTKI